MPYFNKYKARSVWIIFTLFLLLVPGVYADEIVTVTTKDGERYEGVTYKVNKYYKTIKLEKVDFEKNVSFSNIESIVDDKGDDITEEVLGSYFAPEKRQWVSKESKTFKKAVAKPWEGIFRAGLNFSIPAGDYYDGIGSGIGFEGDLRYAITNHLAIRGGISKSGMKSTEDPVLYSYDPNIQVVDTDFRLNAYRYFLGAEYYAPAGHGGDSNDYLYLLSYLGAISHKMELGVTYEYINTGQRVSETAGHTESKFLLGIGLGLTKLLEKNYGLEAGLTFELVPVGSQPSDLYGTETVYAYVIDFKLGFLWFFL